MLRAETPARTRASSLRDNGSDWLPGFAPEAPIRPFLRWAGGKTRLLQKLTPHMPERFGTYHEPFLGGGAVYFATMERASNGAFLSDLNDELVNAWLVVRNQPEEFLRAIKRYEGKNSEVDYYEVREASPKSPVSRAARFFYLNQTAWNSLWRVNRWGVFNVPWGDRPFRGIDPSELRTVSRALQKISIEQKDFREALARPKKGDFVYLDPPYLPVSDTSKFSGYTEKRFRAADLGELAELCRRLSKRGVSWMMSNRDTPKVRELFSFAHIERLTARRSVSAQNRRDVEPVDSPEAIVIGRPVR